MNPAYWQLLELSGVSPSPGVVGVRGVRPGSVRGTRTGQGWEALRRIADAYAEDAKGRVHEARVTAGVGETQVSMLTGAAGMALGGYAGAVAPKGQGAKVVHQVEQALTYQPRMAEGQASTEKVGEGFEAANEAVKSRLPDTPFGQTVGDILIPTALTLLAGVKPVGSMGRAIREAEPGPVGRSAQRGSVGIPEDKGPVFYSPVIRAVESLPEQTASKEQWLQTLKNRPGVKSEELDWYNLENLPEKASKAEVLQYLKANELTVETKVLGSGKDLSIDEAKKILASGREIYAVDYLNENNLSRATLDDNATLLPYIERNPHRFHLREGNIDQAHTRKIGTKFANYQTPGGENYREVLLKLPSAAARSRMYILDASGKEIWRGGSEAEAKAFKAENPGSRIFVGGAAKSTYPKDFTGGHFDEPNILAHARVNDRVTATGDKTLFTEEIQSDWHQKGRREGYSNPKSEAELQSVKDEIKKLTPEMSSAIRDLDNLGYDSPIDAMKELVSNPEGWKERWDIPEGSENHAIIAEYLRLQGLRKTLDTQGQIPDAPFKTSWPELTLKRLIRMAAEEGKDSISWTTGEMQAARYDLSKHLSSVRVHRADGGQFRVEGFSTGIDNARPVIDTVVSADKLADTIGKDLAEQIASDFSGDRSVKRYSGVDLKVGGEGMKAFYDKILVNTANKLGKKYGAKVEEAEIVPSGSPDIMNGEEAATAADVLRVHSLKITPAMKKAALSGQPIAQVRRPSTERVA